MKRAVDASSAKSVSPAKMSDAKGAMSPGAKAVFDRLCVWAFGACWISALIHLIPDLLAAEHAIATGLAFFPALLTSYLMADFLAGAVHWLADRYFDPETPLLGPILIAPFREHHVDSASIGRHDFFEVSGK